MRVKQTSAASGSLKRWIEAGHSTETAHGVGAAPVPVDAVRAAASIQPGVSPPGSCRLTVNRALPGPCGYTWHSCCNRAACAGGAWMARRSESVAVASRLSARRARSASYPSSCPAISCTRLCLASSALASWKSHCRGCACQR
ncbi:hypothetical protein D3C71_1246460 [compost metagenome]